MCIPLSNIIFKQQKTHMESLSMWAFFVLPSSSFHMSFLHNIFLYRSLWNFPYSSNSHRFDLPGLQELIGGVHTAVQHISNFFRGYQGVVIIKHNGQSSFDGLLYCCRMSNHTRYKERATTCVIALGLCLMCFPSMPFSTVLKKSALKFCFHLEFQLFLGSVFSKGVENCSCTHCPLFLIRPYSLLRFHLKLGYSETLRFQCMRVLQQYNSHCIYYLSYTCLLP